MSKQLNFAQQMDEVLKTLGPQRPKLLLHACCGPCSSAVLESCAGILRSRCFTITPTPGLPKNTTAGARS